MEFPFGRTVERLRAPMIEDPYNPDEMIPSDDWSNPDVLEIEGAFVAHTSTSMLATETRQQALEAKSLYCGAADIRKGDRIRDGEHLYTVDGIPPAPDTNPFTGWTAPREIPLTRYEG